MPAAVIKPSSSTIFLKFIEVRLPLDEKIHHKPCGFGYLTNISNENSYDDYFGQDCAQVFWDKIEKVVEDVKKQQPDLKHLQILVKDFAQFGGKFLVQGLDVGVLKNKNWFSKSVKGVQLRFLDPKSFLEVEEDSTKLPHNFLDGFEKLLHRGLPPKNGFDNDLTGTVISDDDYVTISTLWRQKGCETVLDYVREVVALHINSLQKQYETYRKLCIETYNLDPVNYFTNATLAWDAFNAHLTESGIHSGIITDPTMTNFLRSNNRGGVLQCHRQVCKANNKYCPEFNPKQPSTFLLYFDANNLAGWAMSQPLPIDDFSWLNEEEILEFSKNFQNVPYDDEFGFIAEVDLSYPEEIHEKHREFPFCRENARSKEKLNLSDKKNYGLHYRVLQQCVKNGLLIEKIHRVLKFRQSPWIRSFIEYNTDLRAKSETEFEKKFYKKINNDLHGKTYQKVGNVKDRPVYAGFTTLDLGKYFLYDFHYSRMVGKYGEDNLRILYVDTDAIVYEIKTEDFFEDLKNDEEFLQLFDTSELAERWAIPKINKKTIGKMKDECKGMIVEEFFAITKKKYCLSIQRGEDIKKAAGVPSYVKQLLTKEDYRRCIVENVTIEGPVLTTSSEKNEIFTKSGKRALLSATTKKSKRRRVDNN